MQTKLNRLLVKHFDNIEFVIVCYFPICFIIAPSLNTVLLFVTFKTIFYSNRSNHLDLNFSPSRLSGVKVWSLTSFGTKCTREMRCSEFMLRFLKIGFHQISRSSKMNYFREYLFSEMYLITNI